MVNYFDDLKAIKKLEYVKFYNVLQSIVSKHLRKNTRKEIKKSSYQAFLHIQYLMCVHVRQTSYLCTLDQFYLGPSAAFFVYLAILGKLKGWLSSHKPNSCINL